MSVEIPVKTTNHLHSISSYIPKWIIHSSVKKFFKSQTYVYLCVCTNNSWLISSILTKFSGYSQVTRLILILWPLWGLGDYFSNIIDPTRWQCNQMLASQGSFNYKGRKFKSNTNSMCGNKGHHSKLEIKLLQLLRFRSIQH